MTKKRKLNSKNPKYQTPITDNSPKIKEKPQFNNFVDQTVKKTDIKTHVNKIEESN